MLGVVQSFYLKQKTFDSGGIRTHATEVTGALNQRLRPLGHAILAYCAFVLPINLLVRFQVQGELVISTKSKKFDSGGIRTHATEVTGA